MFDLRTGYWKNMSKIPQLSFLASLKLVIHLWKNVKIMHAVLDGSWKYYAMGFDLSGSNNFEILANIVSQKLRHLLVNDLLFSEVNIFVKFIGLELCYWIAENRDCISIFDCSDFLNSIKWNQCGEILIFESMNEWEHCSNHVIIFKRACHYCCEPLVLKLWEKMPEYTRRYFRCFTGGDFLLRYWIHKLHNTMDEFSSVLRNYDENAWNRFENLPGFEPAFPSEIFNAFMALISITNLSSSAVTYFMSLIGHEKISIVAQELMPIAIESVSLGTSTLNSVGIVFSLFQSMNEMHQNIFVQRYGIRFRFLMLNCQAHQTFFRLVIEKMGDLLDPFDHYILLDTICRRIVSKLILNKWLLIDIWDASPRCIKLEFFKLLFLSPDMLDIFDKQYFHVSRILLKDAKLTVKNRIFSFFEI